MAREMQVPFLGKVPLDPLLSKAAEEGRSAFSDSALKGNNSLQDNLKGRPAFGDTSAEGNGLGYSSAQEINGVNGINGSAASRNGVSGNVSKGTSKQFMPSVPALQAIIDQLMQLTEGGPQASQGTNGVHVAQNGT